MLVERDSPDASKVKGDLAVANYCVSQKRGPFLQLRYIGGRRRKTALASNSQMRFAFKRFALTEWVCIRTTKPSTNLIAGPIGSTLSERNAPIGAFLRSDQYEPGIGTISRLNVGDSAMIRAPSSS